MNSFNASAAALNNCLQVSRSDAGSSLCHSYNILHCILCIGRHWELCLPVWWARRRWTVAARRCCGRNPGSGRFLQANNTHSCTCIRILVHVYKPTLYITYKGRSVAGLFVHDVMRGAIDVVSYQTREPKAKALKNCEQESCMLNEPNNKLL